jgi:hypothetical protein
MDISTLQKVKLKRVGCPVDKIPKFNGHFYECPKDMILYTLADGTKCCRKSEGEGKQKKYAPKKEIDKILIDEKECKILNPLTGRWVNAEGRTGKDVINKFVGKPQEKK